MAVITQETRLALDAGERVELADLRDHLLVCESGSVHVGPARDGRRAAALESGGQWRVPDNDAIAVTARTAASLTFRHRQALGPLAAASGLAAAWRRRFLASPLAALPARLLR